MTVTILGCTERDKTLVVNSSLQDRKTKTNEKKNSLRQEHEINLTYFMPKRRGVKTLVNPEGSHTKSTAESNSRYIAPGPDV